MSRERNAPEKMTLSGRGVSIFGAGSCDDLSLPIAVGAAVQSNIELNLRSLQHPCDDPLARPQEQGARADSCCGAQNCRPRDDAQGLIFCLTASFVGRAWPLTRK